MTTVTNYSLYTQRSGTTLEFVDELYDDRPCLKGVAKPCRSVIE